MPGTTIAIAAAGGAVAAGAVARARDAECRAIIAGYDAQTATVEAQREYSHCVMQLHPDPLTGGQLIVAKAAVCVILAGVAIGAWVNRPGPDRKSTRLNSSHITISYAVFCLKKKKKKK